MKKYNWLIVFLSLLLSGGCTTKEKESCSDPFISISEGKFMLNQKPWYYIGTNYWYGPLLGSQGEFGDRKRLLQELDFMKEIGITNLRVLVGADGPDGEPSKVMPALQPLPGKYNESVLDGLDFFMSELAKRNMYAVLYLHNTWEWSGGYAQYVSWFSQDKKPNPSIDGWETFKSYASRFFECDSCTAQFKRHVSFIINRTNFYTGKRYIDDPYIHSWQIANEPRPMAEKNKDLYAIWIKDIADYIKKIDKNHLVSTGSEGEKGSEDDIALYERVHSDSNIDYLTIHIWPKNWSWLNENDIPGSIDKAISNSKNYIEEHVAIAQKYKKPIVVEEFGMPRDHHLYSVDDPTTARDAFYSSIFEQILHSKQSGGVLAGCNFWAWGGSARPSGNHIFWQIGDDYMGDPAQEEQGLNSVFDCDNTIKIIKDYSQKISSN